ncbi:uncharacterized protein LOC131218612 isoform X2 [Magnolia sinica]|uniref:uncharacterized protein LOC131218612 isoform X2 n=1 Tax=Magnolia sinica TaxID=86752 RepID=UPI002659BB4B|nr:uncharacterized protein LOC131218612 isoform X2 [Magnolia sinica]
MKAMNSLQDLIEEAKVRTLWWAICVFGIAYFLSHTSKSMWTNIPISILMLSGLRLLSYEVDFRWKVRPVHRQSYLSHLQKKQLSLDDPRLSTLPTAPRWKRKIDSPLVEAAIDDFINKILQDFMVDLWYSSITPDKEAPEQIHILINDVLGEISRRLKQINLLDLLTRDMVDLIGNHLDLYRRNQSSIGADVMGILSSDERDERLRHHLIASKELHPALLSPECEYKVLQRLMGGVLAVVLRPREAQCPLVRCFARELLTCLVMQPIMNLASPGYINELLECIFLAAKDDRSKEARHDKSTDVTSHHSVTTGASNQSSDMALALAMAKITNHGEMSQADCVHDMHSRPADWARSLDAATQRRTQVLAPENLENMWTKGRNYKNKSDSHVRIGTKGPVKKTSGTISTSGHVGNTGNEKLTDKHGSPTRTEDKFVVREKHGSSHSQVSGEVHVKPQLSQDLNKVPSFEGGHLVNEWKEHTNQAAEGNMRLLKRSNSTSALKSLPDIDKTLIGETGEALGAKELRNPHLDFQKEEGSSGVSVSEVVLHGEGSLHVPKLKCRVVGAYFEKIGSKSFAVYSIAVRDAENKTWFVKRRYRNFERLHRYLKDIPNYTLHLPPKRFLSSSIEDSFVHQRCILLDKYLQDLLSIANVAEQHEVWDFLSVTSKNYAFGKSTSVMKTLAVNVDDAMDDIVRQVKGVSDGLLRKVSGSSLPYTTSPTVAERHLALSWNEEEIGKHSSSHSNMETYHSLSDEESTKDAVHDEAASAALIHGWHSDNELTSKGFPPRVLKRFEESKSLASGRSQQLGMKFERFGLYGDLAMNASAASNLLEYPVGVPPEWTPPNVSVPLLNLVDKIFQLNRRGWLRRQVFWISKQILQLVMEDAIDDWLLRQIQWLRRDDIIAQGIRWVQDVLWPNGTFFLKFENNQDEVNSIQYSQKPAQTGSRIGGDKVSHPSSFEMQLEAARRASYVKKMLLGGAPTALVSLIGPKQYRRCAKDIYYFSQSTICVKQLAYCMLELLLLSLFPELQDLVVDIHEKKDVHPA